MSLKEYNYLQILIIARIGTDLFFSDNQIICKIINKYREKSFYYACKNSIKELRNLNIKI